jgi:hypothetical protein
MGLSTPLDRGRALALRPDFGPFRGRPLGEVAKSVSGRKWLASSIRKIRREPALVEAAELILSEWDEDSIAG